MQRVALFDLTHDMNIANYETINVETPMIDSRQSLEKEFNKLIYMNSRLIL